MSRLGEVIVLSAGGVLGVNARYWLASWMSTWAGDRFPWATFAINVSGSFAIGLIATLLARWLPAHPARLFFLVGFLGGYTTFSSFAGSKPTPSGGATRSVARSPTWAGASRRGSWRSCSAWRSAAQSSAPRRLRPS